MPRVAVAKIALLCPSADQVDFGELADQLKKAAGPQRWAVIDGNWARVCEAVMTTGIKPAPVPPYGFLEMREDQDDSGQGFGWVLFYFDPDENEMAFVEFA